VCVDADEDTVSIAGEPNHALATAVGNHASYPIPAAGTDTTVTITVTAEDGTTKIYTLTVCSMAPKTPMAEGGVTSFIDLGNGEYDEVHVFTTSANATTLTSKLTMKCVPSDVKIFIVAGGGGGGRSGGASWAGSGGGAGGVIIALAAGTAFTVGDYTISVGKGGNPGNLLNGGNVEQKRTYAQTFNGGNSSIVGPGINLVALGGGGGGWHTGGNGGVGGNGGSGGGSYSGAVGSGSGTQGKNGGTHGDYGNAGGGGYSLAGVPCSGTNCTGGKGGTGINANAVPALANVLLNNVPLVGYNGGFAGGGAGGYTGSIATHGGGQRAGAGTNSANNTGGTGVKDTGGGGSGGFSGSNGYAGGSGIVVVRFKYISTPPSP
jgi:hypothetical protein